MSRSVCPFRCLNFSLLLLLLLLLLKLSGGVAAVSGGLGFSLLLLLLQFLAQVSKRRWCSYLAVSAMQQ